MMGLGMVVLFVYVGVLSSGLEEADGDEDDSTALCSLANAGDLISSRVGDVGRIGVSSFILSLTRSSHFPRTASKEFVTRWLGSHLRGGGVEDEEPVGFVKMLI